jgi:DinB family protein
MTVTRGEAIRRLESGQARIEALLARVPARARTSPGVGGGTWTPKDLVGHLASWEERALEALDSWSHGEPAPIDRLLRSKALSALNAGWVEEKTAWTWGRTRRHAEGMHTRIVTAIAEMPDATWSAPATRRGRKPLGDRLGSILGGPSGHFMHAEAHVESLQIVIGPARGRRSLDRAGPREPGIR